MATKLSEGKQKSTYGDLLIRPINIYGHLSNSIVVLYAPFNGMCTYGVFSCTYTGMKTESSPTWLHSQQQLRRFASVAGLGASFILLARLSLDHVYTPSITSDTENKGKVLLLTKVVDKSVIGRPFASYHFAFANAGFLPPPFRFFGTGSSVFAALQSQAKPESNFFAPECKNSWVLDQINASAKAEVELINGAWYDNLPLELEKAYNAASEMQNDMGPTTEPEAWSRFDVMMPAIPHACPSLKRVGSEWDGGKLICGLDQIPDSQERPCIVYSLGSNNQWDFEESIHENTHCRVFTFDCTVSSPTMPDKIKDRVEFHQICLGEGGGLGGKDFKSMKEVMTMLNHPYVTLLKMDIVSTG